MTWIQTLSFTFAVSLLCAGCTQTTNAEEAVLPAQNDGGSGAPVPCYGENGETYRPTVDEILSDGSWPVTVASIESVEPVLDSFARAKDGFTYSDQICSKLADADPALRVRIRVEQTSWDAEIGTVLTMVLDAGSLNNFEAVPLLDGKGRLEWSDGNHYFRTGGRLLVIGGLLETGELYARGRNLMEVSADGVIHGHARGQCVKGTLNGRNVDEVVNLAQEGWDGELPEMKGELPPIATRCL